jgi:hypothetical protein
MSESAVSTSSLPSAAARKSGKPVLIFDWKRPRWRKTKLVFFLTLSVGLHLFLFYLFKVGASPARRTVPPVRGIMVLTPSFPPAAALLDRVENAHPSLTPPLPLTESDADALHQLVKGYQPIWERQTARLKPLPPAATGARLPTVMPTSSLLLPPWPAREADDSRAVAGSATAFVPAETPAPVAVPPVPVPKVEMAPSSPLVATSRTAPASGSIPSSGPPPDSAPALPRALPSIMVQSGLSGRALTRPPVWPAEVLQPDWPADGTASFMVSVSPEGRVLSCLPLSAASYDIEALRHPLLSAEFSPRQDSDETAWGWIDVHW